MDTQKARYARFSFILNTGLTICDQIAQNMAEALQTDDRKNLFKSIMDRELDHFLKRQIPVPTKGGLPKRPVWAAKSQYTELWEQYETGLINWSEFIIGWLDKEPHTEVDTIDFSNPKNWFV